VKDAGQVVHVYLPPSVLFGTRCLEADDALQLGRLMLHIGKNLQSNTRFITVIIMYFVEIEIDRNITFSIIFGFSAISCIYFRTIFVHILPVLFGYIFIHSFRLTGNVIMIFYCGSLC